MLSMKKGPEMANDLNSLKVPQLMDCLVTWVGIQSWVCLTPESVTPTTLCSGKHWVGRQLVIEWFPPGLEHIVQKCTFLFPEAY